MTDIQWNKIRDELQPRIDLLILNKSYIEAFLFLCVILENNLDNLNNLYEKYYTRLALTYNQKIVFSAINKKNLYLSQKITYLSMFVNDREITKYKIRRFITLRNDCVHNILNKNIQSLDTIIKKELSNFYKALWWLTDMRSKLLKSEVNSIKRKIKK